jgi:outer membrane protein assembly factor BamB
VDVPETDPGRPRYTDVDATPVLLGETLFAASFGAGLYGLDPNNGSVLFRDPEWTAITGLGVTSDGSDLVIVSADRGLARVDPRTRAPRWIRPAMRGALGVPEIQHGVIVLGESKGSLIAVDEVDGEELSRIDTGHGFVARAHVADGRAYVVSNGGTLLGMRFVVPHDEGQPENPPQARSQSPGTAEPPGS